MSRLKTIDPDRLDGKVKELLEKVDNGLGIAPNLIKGLAVSPAVLELYINTVETLGRGVLDQRLQRLIPLTVAEANGNSYCLRAFTGLGRIAGVSEKELLMSRNAGSPDERIRAGLKFALAVVNKRGQVSGKDLQHVRDAGYSDAEIVEITAHVGLNIFLNYFTELAETPAGFPDVVKIDHMMRGRSYDVATGKSKGSKGGPTAQNLAAEG
jgi:AhpD family alkylhydroperoxidase